MSQALKLLEAFQRDEKRRIPLDEVWPRFLECFPRLRGDPAARTELRERLQELADRGAIRLPSGRALYDAVQMPPLPRWVELPKPARPASPLERASGIAWHPQLEFVRSLPRLSEDDLEVLQAVQRWLAEGAAEQGWMTVRERSLRLFGDEKRLERVAQGQLFAASRLSLDLLRCREVHVPFVVRDFGTGTAALIVENKDTYHSACCARAGVPGASVRWIIFGAGKALSTSVRSFLDWPAPPSQIHYFGDIDREGLAIAVRARAALREMSGFPPLECVGALYALVIARAARGSRQDSLAELGAQLQALLNVLPPHLHESASCAIAEDLLWPQEWVTEVDFVGWLGDTTRGSIG